MFVFYPTGGLDVNFSAADPFHPTDLHAGILEVRTSMGISVAWVKDLNGITGSSLQLMFIKILELPYIMEKGFRHRV